VSDNVERRFETDIQTWIPEQTKISLCRISCHFFITATQSVYCAVRSVYFVVTILEPRLRVFTARYDLYILFVWIPEQTSISLCRISCHVFYNRDSECLLRGTICIFCCHYFITATQSVYCAVRSVYYVCMDPRTNKYFPMPNQLSFFITATQVVYCAIRTVYLNGS
jgi:hypothetical protein